MHPFYAKPRQDTQTNKQKCKFGFLCSLKEQNKCLYYHTDLDDKKMKAYQQLKLSKNKKTIVVLNTCSLTPAPTPICLFHNFLPIMVHQKMRKGIYYEAKLVDTDKINQMLHFELIGEVGVFGQIEREKKIMKEYMLIIYGLSPYPNAKIETFSGYIEVNWQNMKVLKWRGKKYFSYVNEKSKYALFNKCKIKFYQNKNSPQHPKVYAIEYDHPRITGILQINPAGFFYLIPRNMGMDDLIPINIPERLFQHIQQLQQFVPYSFLKSYQIEEKLSKSINEKLKKYIVRGIFYDWPAQSQHPLIKLQSQFHEMEYQTRKDAIIFQYNIDAHRATPLQMHESKTICQNFSIDNFKNRFQWNNPTFTFDTRGTQCFDDALSATKMDDGLEIGIHIADVSQLLGQNDPFYRQIMRKDETVYIKGYFSTLLSRQMIQILSLKQNCPKIAYTLKFLITNNGLIDFKTIKFEPTIIQVQKNEYHSPNLSNKEQFRQLIEVSRILVKSNFFSTANFINEKTETEKLVSRLVQLSAMLPTALLKFNQEKARLYKNKIDEQILDMLENLSEKIEKWDEKSKMIKRVKNRLKQCQQKQQQIQALIRSQIQARKNQLQVQRQGDLVSEKISSPDCEPQQVLIHAQTEISESENENNSQEDQSPDSQNIINHEQKQKLSEESTKQLQLNLKKIKTVIYKKKTSSKFSKAREGEREMEEEEIEDNFIGQNINKRYNEEALNSFKLVAGIFNHFKMRLSWKKIKDIKEDFQKLQKLNPLPLFNKYLKRIQIINQQHYKQWIIILHQIKKTENFADFQEKINPIIDTKQQYNKDPKSELQIEKQIKDSQQIFLTFKKQEEKSSKQEQLLNQQIQEIGKKSQKNFKEYREKCLEIQQQVPLFSSKISPKDQEETSMIRIGEESNSNLEQIEKKQSQKQKMEEKMSNPEIIELKAQLEKKYRIQELKEDIQRNQKKLQQSQITLKKLLNEVVLSYNFLSWINKNTQVSDKDQEIRERNESIKTVLNLAEKYCDQVNIQFRKLKEDELEKMMIEKIEGPQQMAEESIREQNKKFINFFKFWSELNYQLQLLKWNNPIRSYAAIKTQKIIKKYEWIFNGNLSPLKAFQNFQQLKELKTDLKQIEDFKIAKRDSGMQSKKLKECNRQIQKLEFFQRMKNEKDKTFRFLNISSPYEEKVKYVFHEILEEIQVSNSEGLQLIKYQEIDGEVEIKNEFPLQIKIKVKP